MAKRRDIIIGGGSRQEEYCCLPEGTHNCIAHNSGTPSIGFLSHQNFQVWYFFFVEKNLLVILKKLYPADLCH